MRARQYPRVSPSGYRGLDRTGGERAIKVKNNDGRRSVRGWSALAAVDVVVGAGESLHGRGVMGRADFLAPLSSRRAIRVGRPRARQTVPAGPSPTVRRRRALPCTPRLGRRHTVDNGRDEQPRLRERRDDDQVEQAGRHR